MRKFFASQSDSLVALPVLTLVFAWNLVQGAVWPVSLQAVPRIAEGRANQIAIGPSLPPPCDGGACVTSPTQLFS